MLPVQQESHVTTAKKFCSTFCELCSNYIRSSSERVIKRIRWSFKMIDQWASFRGTFRKIIKKNLKENII